MPLVLLLVAFLPILCSPATAQVQLSGRVIEVATERPISGATVTLQDEDGRNRAQQVTDAAGLFSFSVSGGGRVRLQAERVGYQRTTTPALDLHGDSVYQVEVRLGIAAVPLDPLNVVARSGAEPSPTLAGFERRRLEGLGWFITREEIGRSHAALVTDLLGLAPGVWLRPGGAGGGRIVYMARAAECPAHIFVDGMLVNPPTASVPSRRGSTTTEAFPIDDVVSLESVEGIEVYPGLSRLPPEFRRPDVTCGVVAIWTRRGP